MGTNAIERAFRDCQEDENTRGQSHWSDDDDTLRHQGSRLRRVGLDFKRSRAEKQRRGFAST